MTGRPEGAARAVIVVSSHVVRGSVGNRAAVFALEHLGFPVWAVPTVVLPWHPGHGRGTRIVAPAGAFASMMAEIAAAPWLGEVGAVLTGYLGDAAQAGPVAALVRAVKARNPGALHLCDPVIGDAGGLYVPEATAVAIRDVLLPLADIATPNRHELRWLGGGGPIEDGASTVAAALALGPATTVVTSAPATTGGSIASLLVHAGETFMAEHRTVPRPPNGPGDLFAALFLGHRLNGLASEAALQRATASVFEVIARAARRGADELMLETDASCLLHPMAMVQTRRLHRPDGGGDPA